MKKTATILSAAYALMVLTLAGAALQACCCQNGFDAREKEIIDRQDGVMYVTTLPQDSVILRAPSRDLSERELRSARLRKLVEGMYLTVTDPSQDGVGIAAPQVGINRRIIWVQRLDKDGEPFECYLNVHLDSLWGEERIGPEGCLSVPGMRGIVRRSGAVLVSYLDRESLEPRKDTVKGFTAVIFQHECDHLDGILYIDKADSLYRSPEWEAEREAFDYSRPEWWKSPAMPNKCNNQ